MTERCTVSLQTGEVGYVFPIYLYSEDGTKTPNMNKEIVSKIEDNIGKAIPEDILDYIYAVLHSPNYREKYKEFLIKNIMNEPSRPFSVYGVTDIESSSVGAKYTITGVVAPFKYFSIAKNAKLMILVKFKEKGIRIAYPKRVNIDVDEYESYI